MRQAHRRLSPLVIVAGLAPMFVGCGGGPSTLNSSGPGPSHGGNLMAMPKDAGMVELAFERTDGSTKGARAKGRIVAYFTGPSGTGTPATPPTDVVFTDDQEKSHPLAPKSGGTDGAARFESAEVTMPAATELQGRLTGKLGSDLFSLVNRPR